MAPLSGVTGSISIKLGDLYHTLRFVDHGWLAADIVQYLDEVITAEQPQIAILKLLGYTMEVSKQKPPRRATHWVEVDLGERMIVTNSDLLRKAVEQAPPGPQDPYHPLALRRIYRVLDRFDFTVKFRSR